MSRLPRDDQLGDPDPWLESLRGANWLLKSPSREQIEAAKENGIVWLAWRVGDRAPAIDRVHHEAVELLALLAHRNYDKFTGLLRHLWPEASTLWLRVMRGKRMRLGVEVVTSDPGQFIQVGERYVEKDMTLLASDEYVDRRLQLEEALQSSEVLSDSLIVPVRLTIEAHAHLATDTLQKLWREMRLLVDLQAARDERKQIDSQTQMRSLFRVTEIDVTAARQVFEVEDILRAGEIAACGVLMYPLAVNNPIRVPKTAYKYVPTLNQLLGACDVSDGFQHVDTFDMSTGLWGDVEGMDGYFLALLVSRSIKVLQFRGRCGLKNNTRAWMWLGAVAFNRTTRNSIETIAIDCRAMNSEGVDAMQRTVISTDPIRDLFPIGDDIEALDEIVTASRCEVNAGDEWYWTVDLPTVMKNLRVVRRDNGSSEVLLPGWGRALVEDATPIPWTASPRLLRNRSTRNVVFKHVSVEEGPLVIGFCSTVGSYLRQITFLKSDISASTMRAILQSCPHLEELVLKKVSLESLESIADQYEAGGCHVHTLVIDVDLITVKATVHQFFDRLADSRHPMAKYLRVLYFNFKTRGNTLPKIKASVLRMLQLNRRIYEFHLDVRPSEPQSVASESVEDIAQAEFDHCDGELVEEPLGMGKMLAFLSVVDCNSASRGSGSIERPPSTGQALNASVTSTIFHFAGDYRERWLGTLASKLKAKSQQGAKNPITIAFRDRLALCTDHIMQACPSHERINVASAMGVLWLKWPTYTGFRNVGVPTPIYEAVELLELLARVDYAAYEDLLMEWWPAIAPLWRRHLTGKRVTLGVEVATMGKCVFPPICERFLETDVEPFASSGYLQLRRDLEAAMPSNDSRVEVPVRLKILKPGKYEKDYSSEMWSEIRLVVAAQFNATCACAKAQEATLKSMYRINDVELGPYARSFASADLIWTLRLAAKGIRVSPLLVRGSDPYACRETRSKEARLKSEAHTIATLDQLLRAETSSIPLNQSFRAPTKVEVESVYDARTIDRVFSALLDCESIRDVVLPSPSYREDNTRWWQWIAVVFFHETANNVIDHVLMKWSSLTRQDIAAFVDSMSARDPLATLFPPSTSSTKGDEHCERTVTASRIRILQPQSERDQRINCADILEFGSAVKNIRVLDEDKDGFAVLLPGWGKAWVAREDASMISTTRSHQSPSSQPLRRIEFKGLREDQDKVCRTLCRAMGSWMRKLTITKHGDVYSTIGEVLGVCPHVTELEMNKIMLKSLEPIACAYEAGVCTANTLELQLEYLSDSANAYRFFERLADANHPMAKHIRVLRFVYIEPASNLPNIESAVLRMLQQNRSIYKFDLQMSQWITDATRRSENVAQEEFDRCDGELVFDRLALHRKLAFLSVIENTGASQASHNSTSPRAMAPGAIHAVDASVVTTIFQFAGESRRRWVRVQF